MKKILFIIPLLIMAAGCTKEDKLASRLILDSDTVNVSGTGGAAEIGYTIENPAEGQSVKALSGESWITDIDESTEGVIRFNVAQNLTEETREAAVEVSYGSVKTYFTVIQSDEIPVEGDFAIEALSVNDFEIKCSITPKDGNVSYLYGLIDRETYNRFSSNEFFWDYVIENTPDFASKAVSGNTAEASFDHLEPSTDYVIYSAGIGSDGDNSTEVSIFRFTTGEPVSFELSQEVDGPMVTLNVKPSYDDRWYLSEAFTVAECGDKENAFGYITSFIQDECDMMSWYMGLSKEEYMRGILSIGESSKLKELYASTDYYAIAVAYDFECNATSEMTITEFSTEAVKERDLLISIDISEITSLGAKWKATTTTDDQYLLFVEAVDVINEQWSDDDEELANIIAGIFPTTVYGRRGDQEGSVTNLTPGTRYMAFAFGCEAYTPTTRLFKTYFTTEEAIVGDVEFELIFDKYYDGTELEQLYPSDFSGASGYAVLPVRAYTLNGSGFFYGIYDGDYTDLEEWPDDLVIENLVLNGITESSGNYLIPYNTTRTALGVAYDANNNYGKVFRKTVYCTEDEALPGSEFSPASVRLSEAADTEKRQALSSDMSL